MVEVTPNAPSSVLAKRKSDDVVGPSGHKKLMAPMSLRALRQVVGLILSAGRLSIVHDMP